MSTDNAITQAASLSDEDFMNQLGTNPSFLVDDGQEQQQDDSTDEQEPELEQDPALGEQEAEEEQDLPEEEDEQGEDEPVQDENEQEQEQEEEEDAPEQEESSEDEEEDSKSEAQSFYDEITKPFKANNREVQVKSPEEARKLMQMGLGYAKRMSDLKPNMQVIRTLEQAELLDHDKINFMVDLMKGDSNAIMKLLEESKFDLDSVENLTEQAQAYKATNKIVSAETVELDEVIARHRDNPAFNPVAEDVKSWDVQALTELKQSPEILSHLVAHQEKGVYSVVADEVARRVAVGDPSVAGLNALQAYTKIGGILDAQGAFDNDTTPTDKPSGNAQAAKDALTNALNKRKPTKPTPNKRAAATPRPAKPKPPIKAPTEEALAELSDEEFMKQFKL